MKYFFLLLFLCSKLNVHAQHCPFDGAYILVIAITNDSGKMIPPPTKYSSLTIRYSARDLTIEDTTSNCKKLLQRLQFDTCAKVVLQTADVNWNKAASAYANQKIFTDPNYFAIVLNSAQVDNCLKPKHTNYYLEISLTHPKLFNTSKTKVLLKNIYPLCTKYMQWDKIKPVILKYPKRGKFYGH